MKSYDELDKLFTNDEFRIIDQDENATKFYFVRTISKKNEIMAFAETLGSEFEKEIFNEMGIPLKKVKVKDLVRIVFESKLTSVDKIKDFILVKYNEEIEGRDFTTEALVKELNALQYFDWGGSMSNSLEKNIVNNYIKKMPRFADITIAVEGKLLESLRGYTLNSWYNHWSSILIEDLFKGNSRITPTVGRIKKIDFFINNIPFDLKVTYFPEGLMADKLKESGFGVELTQVKKKAKELGILIPEVPDKELNIQLQQLIKEEGSTEAIAFIDYLNNLKRSIINDAQKNPDELIKWLYENQGEMRFDASNRFFIILTDTQNLFESWKLKRNIKLLKSSIQSNLEEIILNGTREIKFHWNNTNRDYTVKADVIFISK